MCFDNQPPNPPWSELTPQKPAEGFLSYYLSDELSPFAVRAVTLLANNKSDPNLETGTYGLFSTCAHGMRASVVKNRYEYIFFLTRYGPRRALVGYYRLRWYAPGTLVRRPPDFALAAEEVHFVHPPISVMDLPPPLAQIAASRFRIFKHVDARATAALAELLRVLPNRTHGYLCEINRLERFNQFYAGYRYPSWKQTESFDWKRAGEYLRAGAAAGGQAMRTTSASGSWQCAKCDGLIQNQALLKRCPECGAMDALMSA